MVRQQTAWRDKRGPSLPVADLPLFSVPAKPLSRSRDESTSHLAEAQLVNSGKWKKQALDVLEFVRANPGWTAREYDAAFPGSLEAGGICHRRLPDIEKLRWVRRGEKRPCKITRKLATTWLPAEVLR